MKKLIFLSFALPFFSFQCDKGNFMGKCLKGKVVRITCASTVVQVLNNNKVGDNDWKDSMATHKSYDHVFSVSNKCELPATLKAGDEFWFIIDTAMATQCIVCMMYDAPPKSLFHVKNVSSEPCKADQ